MAIVKTVLIVLAVLVVLYVILNVFFKKSTDLTGMHKTSDKIEVIEASTIPAAITVVITPTLCGFMLMTGSKTLDSENIF